MKTDRRGSWYLLTGIVVGAALGLAYSWVVSPVRYVDAPPYALRADYKDDYRAMVAMAYLYSHDLLRAEGRLAQLKDDHSAQDIALQAQRALAEGRPPQEVSALNALADALSGSVPATPVNSPPTQQATFIPSTGEFTPTPLIVTTSDSTATALAIAQLITSTAVLSGTPVAFEPSVPLLTSTPRPTLTPSPTQGSPFVLQETRLVCDVSQVAPLIQVELRDAAGQPVPGVEMLVTWQTGSDHFFTGLQSEIGLGYGDFVITPGVTYSIQPAGGGQLVSDLTASECVAEDGSHFWGAWYLVFAQP